MHLQQLLTTFLKRQKYILSRGLCFQQLRNLREALNDINKAVELDPEGYAYYYFRSGLRNQMGDNAGYKSDLKTSAVLLNDKRLKGNLTKKRKICLSFIQK